MLACRIPSLSVKIFFMCARSCVPFSNLSFHPQCDPSKKKLELIFQILLGFCFLRGIHGRFEHKTSPITGGEFTQNYSVLRVVKLNRLFRLCRAVRVIGVVSRFFDYLDLRLSYNSGVVVVLCRVAFIFVLFTWLNHLISCAWVGIGFHAPSDTGLRWMDLSVLSVIKFSETPPRVTSIGLQCIGPWPRLLFLGSSQ